MILEQILPLIQIDADVSSQEDSMPRMIAKTYIKLNWIIKVQIYQKSTKNNPLDTGNIYNAAYTIGFFSSV